MREQVLTQRCGLRAGAVAPGEQAVPGPVVAAGCACALTWLARPGRMWTCHQCGEPVRRLTRRSLARRCFTPDQIERLFALGDVPELEVA